MPKVSRIEVITTGARRRWTLAEKQRIVAESFAFPRNVSGTAHRHGLSNGQLFAWRRLAREGKLVMGGDGAGFVPAIVAGGHCVPDPPNDPHLETLSLQFGAGTPAGGRMEIVLSGNRRVIVGTNVDAAALKRVLDVLEGRPVCRSPREGR
jgi:transposase